jgi:hypothetical protein
VKKIEAATLQETRLMAIIIFSGDLDPNPEAAAEALRKAGYQVIKMPEEFRPLLAHPRDDFFEVMKPVVCDPEKIMDESSRMMDELNEIVDRYEAIADDCGPIEANHIPFASIFGELTVRGSNRANRRRPDHEL